MSTDTSGVRRVVSVTVHVALDAQTFRYTRKLDDGTTIVDGVADYVRALVSEGDSAVLTPVLSEVAIAWAGNASRDSPLTSRVSGDVDTAPEE